MVLQNILNVLTQAAPVLIGQLLYALLNVGSYAEGYDWLVGHQLASLLTAKSRL